MLLKLSVRSAGSEFQSICVHCSFHSLSYKFMYLAIYVRFPEASAYFHEEEKEGIVKICQLALHKKFPRYATDGYEVLYPRPPVIYLSAAAKPNLGQFLCHQVTS